MFLSVNEHFPIRSWGYHVYIIVGIVIVLLYDPYKDRYRQTQMTDDQIYKRLIGRRQTPYIQYMASKHHIEIVDQ